MTIDVSAEETLTSEHEQIIRSTLTSLQASFSSDIRAEVKLKVRGSWTSAEVVVTADGMTVRSEMRASDALLAVDGAVAQLLLQLAKYKNVAAPKPATDCQKYFQRAGNPRESFLATLR